VAWLHHWKEVFTNEGRGTFHDPSFLATSTIRFPPGQENVRWGLITPPLASLGASMHESSLRSHFP
jgi:hypothetical protein